MSFSGGGFGRKILEKEAQRRNCRIQTMEIILSETGVQSSKRARSGWFSFFKVFPSSLLLLFIVNIQI